MSAPNPIADTFDIAAEVIRSNGLHKGGMYAETNGKQPQECPVCIWGALCIATGATPMPLTNERLRLATPAADALAAYLGLNGPHGDSMWTLPEWNDAPGRTADEVVAALKGAARAERAKVAAT